MCATDISMFKYLSNFDQSYGSSDGKLHELKHEMKDEIRRGEEPGRLDLLFTLNAVDVREI